MANFTLDQTGQEIQDILDTVGNNQATSGQVLTANGNGGASWQNASGGLTEVKASDVNSETATNGQILTANGSGGASFKTLSALLLNPTEQTFSGDTKTLNTNDIVFKSKRNTNNYINIHLTQSNSPQLFIVIDFNNNANYYANKIEMKKNGRFYTFAFPSKTGTIALTSDINAKVPDAPDTDGTYTLKCVVSNGGTTKTYQWVLDN